MGPFRLLLSSLVKIEISIYCISQGFLEKQLVGGVCVYVCVYMYISFFTERD